MVSPESPSAGCAGRVACPCAPGPWRTCAAQGDAPLESHPCYISTLTPPGSIVELEAKVYLRIHGARAPAEEVEDYWQNMLRTADTNGDGEISKTEFLEYVLQDEELDDNGDYKDKQDEDNIQTELAEVRTAAAAAADSIAGVTSDHRTSRVPPASESRALCSTVVCATRHPINHSSVV